MNTKRYSFLLLGIGSLLFGLSTLLAAMEKVSQAEKSLFHLFYDLPEELEPLAASLATLGTLGIVLITLGLCAYQKHYLRALLVISSALGAFAIAYGVKVLISRARPAELLGIIPRGQMDIAVGDSFPSGHVAVATVVTLLLFFHVPSQGRLRLLLWFMPLAVGASRLYMGEHMPLDIIGGIGVGLIAGSVLELGSQWLTRYASQSSVVGGLPEIS